MRITVDVAESLVDRARAAAAREGETLDELVERALIALLGGASPPCFGDSGPRSAGD